MGTTFLAIAALAKPSVVDENNSFGIEILDRWIFESSLDEVGPRVRARLTSFNTRRLVPASHVFVWSPNDAQARWVLLAT
jgi:hypothetical protein